MRPNPPPATLILDDSTARWPDEAAFLADLLRLPLAEQARILRKRRPEDRRAAALGRLLLQAGLEGLGYHVSIMKSILYAPSGRPFLAAGPAFNIAHSGSRVVCALAPDARRVGIDVEALRNLAPEDLEDLEDTMDPAQWAAIRADAAPAHRFLAFWTKKESVAKATGQGLALPLATLAGTGDELRFGGETWRVEALALDEGHVGHVAVRVG